ncbi:DUF6470 family protein [Paenibacillus cymbidii]|uniref:DUF6470 family protein n=1 Tax=Paenibacillus cymbidii TaxID=1639034 RepID=UPI001F265C6F|nr:DUF6470 family protein [Paenibacillus cymbidii]
MIPFPQIEIRQTPAKLGIDADLGEYSIRQPKATYEMKRIPSQLEIHSQQADMKIDQMRAWDALGLGNVLESMHRIYAQARTVALQGIERIVQDGNRMAAIHTGENAIAEIAKRWGQSRQEFDYYGPASIDNVDVEFHARKPNIVVTDGRIEVNARPNRPEIDYTRGKLDIYVLQYGKVDIMPPQIDLKL